MKLRTQLLLGYATVLLLMILMAAVSYKSSQSLLRTQRLVEEARAITASARLFQKSMVDMQASIRGFLIVGEEQYLQPFEQARQSYEMHLGKLKQLVAHDRRQLERLDEIASLVQRWLTSVALPEIEERRKIAQGEGTLEAIARRMTQERANGDLFAEIRDKANDFLDMERNQLEKDKQNAARTFQRDVYEVIGCAAAAVLIGLGAALIITQSVLRQVGGEPREIAVVTEQIARGKLDVQIEGGTGIRASVAAMLAALRKNRSRTERQDWLKSGIARLNDAVSGAPEIDRLAAKVMAAMCRDLDAQVGALYVSSDQAGKLTLAGSFASSGHGQMPESIELGEGLVGQAALEKQQILVSDVPQDYFKVTSALGQRAARHVWVAPFLYYGRLEGVVELGTLGEVTEPKTEYLRQAMPVLAVAVEAARGRARLAHALEDSQRLTEELQTQQEELKVINEELEQQTRRLEDSEQRLKVQHEELEVTNEELKEKNELLERQKSEVEQGRKKLAGKAKELTLASKYKSEFLANMSHELRTPLNSLLLLSQDLARNKEGNLTEQQIESSQIIHGSGKDLLNLINDVLDLSKIEAGRMDMRVSKVHTGDLVDSIRASFDHVARDKGLTLEVVLNEDAPSKITSDRKRIEQILRNLVSNAIKFTEQGAVTVAFGRPMVGAELPTTESSPDQYLAITVKDTGIGIDPKAQKIIFEAFQQADGGTARKYGGTGLGLSISRELAHLLGGKMNVESTPDEGSTFTLYLPVVLPTANASVSANTTSPRRRTPTPPSNRVGPGRLASAAAVKIEDDRDQLEEQDRVVLIIEDDPKFARLLRNKCHEKAFKCLVASTGEAGLALATEYLPSAILLDVCLPGMDGWSVLNALKEDTRVRHIPVHVASVEERSAETLRKGAIGHAVKPLDQDRLDEVFHKLEEASDGRAKRVLVVEDDEGLRRATVHLLAEGNVLVEEAETGQQALDSLRGGGYDCVVLDLGLPDMDGDRLLAALEEEGIEMPPVVVHTGRDLTAQEEMALREHAESIVIKDVRSQERLLDEVSLFLHRVVSKMPESSRKIIWDLHDSDALLRGRKVLIVDDDMRTTFAMSHLLSGHGMETLKAENGERALRLLNEQPDVELVLMDIMMPVMDGYEAMKRIRRQNQFGKLPIIVLTAKAMPEDREKCLEAGANDYLPKPVDPQRLLSLLRVWLHR